MTRHKWLCQWLAGVLLLGSVVSVQATSVEDAERVYRQEALAHADAVVAAFRQLEEPILDLSAAATVWVGDVPPPLTGWRGEWTVRGVRAQYCANTLVVYLGPASVKGVGSDHRAVHAAPQAYIGGGLSGQIPPLHWLTSGQAEGGPGRGSVMMPACMTGLPDGRAALAGLVSDPFNEVSDRVTHERRVETCAVGEHGDGVTQVREITQDFNGRGDPIGSPVVGPWADFLVLCRADYTEVEHFDRVCTWDAGAPFNREMTGREVWSRVRTVDSGGVSLGAPVFMSTSCWSGSVAAIAPPAVTSVSSIETRTLACRVGMPALESGQRWEGDMTERRTVRVVSTQFEWDAVPTTQSAATNWVVVNQNCSQYCYDGPGSGFIPCQPERCGGQGGGISGNGPSEGEACEQQSGEGHEGAGMGHGQSGNAGAGPDGVGANAGY